MKMNQLYAMQHCIFLLCLMNCLFMVTKSSSFAHRPTGNEHSSNRVQSFSHVFVTAFFDLQGFRDHSNAYMLSLHQLIRHLPNLVIICEVGSHGMIQDYIKAERKQNTVKLYARNRNTFKVFQRYPEEIRRCYRAMLHQHTEVNGWSRNESDILRFDESNSVQYMLINHLKFDILAEVLHLHPFRNISHMTWIDAGIFRHSEFVDGTNFTSLPSSSTGTGTNTPCYTTNTTRLATGTTPNQPWPDSNYTTVYLYLDRREVAATVMTFSVSYFVRWFYPQYFALLDDLLSPQHNVTSSEQGVLSLYAQRYPAEIEHVATGYRHILTNMFDCSSVSSHYEYHPLQLPQPQK